MRPLLFFILLNCASVANAKVYYVSTSGNDANAGTSSTAPWKTLARVNAFTFAANDSILFKRGDVFFGSVIVKRNNLTFSAYGSGARPIITGLISATGWTAIGNGVYECTVTAKKRLNVVLLNGAIQQIGRYPNATDANGGFLTYEAATTTSVTDNQLSGTVNWTGAEVAIKKKSYWIDRCIVTSQSGGTINYKMGRSVNSNVTPSMASATLGYGYFFMNDPRTLDQAGEWYFDSTKSKLQMYFGSANPSAFNIQVSAVDTLFNIGVRTSIRVSNISFNGGNTSGIYALNAANITVDYCDLNNIGGRGIQFSNIPNVLIDNVTVNNVLSSSIQVYCKNQPNVTIRNCTVKNNGLFAGMGSYFDGCDYKGMYADASSNLLIEYNVVDSIGLAGIQFQGNDVVVRNNRISNFCNTLEDQGGVYTYVSGTDANPGAYYTNRLVTGNIVSKGIGAPQGTTSTTGDFAGIYLDGRTMNVTVTGNTVFDCNNNAFQSNNPKNINVYNNTFYNNLRDVTFTRWAWGSISNLNIKRNISFSMNSTQRNMVYTNAALNTPVPTTIPDDLKKLGSMDSNYFHSISDAGFALEMYETEGGAPIPVTPFSLGGWQAFSGFDIASKKPAQVIQAYTINSQKGSNLFPNSQFTSNINNTTIYGTGVTAAWDNTSKVNGTGSLRMMFATPTANRYGLLYNTVGAVSSTKKYIVRYTTVGTSTNGVTRAYISKQASPYTQLTAIQSASFGLDKKRHEFLFVAPLNEANARFMIEVAQTSGTTYIDDIEFYEVDATVNTIESQVKFLYNDTKSERTYSLDAKYIGVDSTVYNGTITLQPYSSTVMVKAGPVDTLPVAIAGADVVVKLPVDSVLLSGTATGTVVAYSWTKIAGPSQYTLINASTAKAKLTNLSPGTYTFQFRITTKSGFTAADTVNVIVSSVLPVTLVEFNAKPSKGQAQLKWVTTNEVNSSHYEIQRSSNGKEFETVGSVESNNSLEKNTYNFTDNISTNNVVYYRLSMVDKDGSFAYSKVISVSVNAGKSFAVEKLSVRMQDVNINLTSTEQQPFSFMVTDVNGRILLSKHVELEAGYNTLTATLPVSATGIYYVKMMSSNSTFTKAVVRQ